MSTVKTATADRAEAAAAAEPVLRGVRSRADGIALACYVVAALFVMGRLWVDPAGRMLQDNRQDSIFFQWMFEHGVNVLTSGVNPFVTSQLNAPEGVNLMSNTVMLGLTLPFAPLTMLAGSGTSLVLLLTLALAGTAWAWYHVLSRHVVASPLAAFVGGAFCGFAPSSLAHAAGHPNIVFQVLVPFIVVAVLRLREPGGQLRKVATLAVLVVYQAFVNEEILFLLALAMGLFVLVYGVREKEELRSWLGLAAKRMGIAALASAAVLGYPLWVQFFGRSAGHGIPQGVEEFGADLAAYAAYSRTALAGHAEVSAQLAQGATEENSFYGWPLLLIVVVIAGWLWRSAVARAVAVTGLVFAVLALGPHLRFKGTTTGIPLPWTLINELPLFDSVVPTRMSLVVTAAMGVLLALALDRVAASPRPARLPWLLAVSCALLPLLPTQLPTQPRPVSPIFFTGGAVEREVGRGTVVPVPVGWNEYLNAMQWQVDSGLAYRTVGGYFLAPHPSDPEGRNHFGPEYRPTALLWLGVQSGTQPAEVDDEQRVQAVADLRYWQATAIVLPANAPAVDALKITTDRLVGREGRQVEDVWLWDVRDLSGAGG